MVIVICSGHKLLCRNSDKGVGHASTLRESILHKVIIIYQSSQNITQLDPDENFWPKPISTLLAKIHLKSVLVHLPQKSCF